MRQIRLGLLISLCAFLFSQDLLAAKKDFRGLFGSYRREKFIENEGRSTDFGMDIMLSTMLPLGGIVSSNEGGGFQALPNSLFFNIEGNFFVTIAYNFEFFASVGYLSFDTRKENDAATGERVFHNMELSAIPILGGLKYRFSNDDLVPYVGIAGGIASVKRSVTYDNAPSNNDSESTSATTINVIAGMEFFFNPRAGVRLEMSAYNIRLAARSYRTGAGTPSTLPDINYEANPWLIRYASGIFLLF